MKVEILDSPDGSNPVIIVEQDKGFGLQFLQLDKHEAEKLVAELQEKVEELGGDRDGQ